MQTRYALIAAAVAMLSGCSAPPAPPPGVDTSPLLLMDAEETEAYVASFPVDDYDIHRTPSACGAVPAFVACMRQRLTQPYIGNFLVEREGFIGLIKTYHRDGRIWEPHVVEKIEEHIEPGTVALDVGAYVGTHALLMARLVGAAGRVYAFEPQRQSYAELRHNIVLNGIENVAALRYAVGDRNAIVEMEASPNSHGGRKVGRDGEPAELRTLDSFGFEHVSLVKIDVEGHERQVLAGMANLMAWSRPAIVIEILGGRYYPGVPPEDYGGDIHRTATEAEVEDIHAIWALIEAHGYTVSPIAGHNYLALPQHSRSRGASTS